MGEVEVTIVPENPISVLDHEVKLADGTTFNNPMRVIADGTGCEVVFTLRRRLDQSDDDYEADTTAIRTDLATPRSLSAEQTVPDPVALWTSSAFVEEVRTWVAAQPATRQPPHRGVGAAAYPRLVEHHQVRDNRGSRLVQGEREWDCSRTRTLGPAW